MTSAIFAFQLHRQFRFGASSIQNLHRFAPQQGGKHATSGNINAGRNAKPIGPYNHIAKAGAFICISATAGVDPVTGTLAGPDVASQTRAIMRSFDVMLQSVGSDFEHVLHVNVFLKDMSDFDEMNQAYIDMIGASRPARSVISVLDVPRQGAALTMNLTAVCRD